MPTNPSQRNYLARDFDSFRAALLDYARQNFPDKIQDFSEASVGGMFLDFAAYVGDNLSFYLDHLYNELSPDTVVETGNIERILRNSGVPITGATGATVSEDFYVEVPVVNDGSLKPDPDAIPTILAGTTVQSNSGVSFKLIENIEMWEIDTTTNQIVVHKDAEIFNGRRINGVVVSKVIKKSGIVYSGNSKTETFSIGDFVPFRRIQLSQPNVTMIESVTDSLGNVYYEVGNLTHDVVYVGEQNHSRENENVESNIKVVPAPYRFVQEVSLSSRKSTLVFGGGTTSSSLNDDIIPDPSEFAFSLPHGQTFSRVPINPQRLLSTTTLGIAGINTTLTVTYRYGGGLSHNCEAGSIKNVVNAELYFPANPSQAIQQQIVNSLEVSNSQDASGGDDAPSKDELLALVPAIKSSQERITSKEDLLARIYTMPSNFGRVFRAFVGQNYDNPLATRLYIVSRNKTGELVPCSDSLKINLKKYLNSYRMTSDAIDIMDAEIINFELKFQIVAHPSVNKSILLQSVISSIKEEFDIRRMHIGKPIIISDIQSIIAAKNGVISVVSIEFKNLVSVVNNKSYSSFSFNMENSTKHGVIYPSSGGIFEIKYPDINISGKCVLCKK